MLNLAFIDRAERWIGQITSYVFLISVAVMGYEVVARYLFNAPTIWAHESTIALTGVGFLFAGAYTLNRREHIRITSLYQLFPASVRWAIDVFSYLVTLFYIGLLLYGAWWLAGRAWATMETSASAWNQPTPVLIKSALVVGSALILLQALVHLLQLLGLARKDGTGAPPATPPSDERSGGL